MPIVTPSARSESEYLAKSANARMAYAKRRKRIEFTPARLLQLVFSSIGLFDYGKASSHKWASAMAASYGLPELNGTIRSVLPIVAHGTVIDNKTIQREVRVWQKRGATVWLMAHQRVNF